MQFVLSAFLCISERFAKVIDISFWRVKKFGHSHCSGGANISEQLVCGDPEGECSSS